MLYAVHTETVNVNLAQSPGGEESGGRMTRDDIDDLKHPKGSHVQSITTAPQVFQLLLDAVSGSLSM